MARIDTGRAIHLVGRILIALVMAVVLLGAVGKLLDLGGFRDSLDSWALVPARFHPPISIAVPLVEIAVASAWFVGVHRSVMVLFAGGMIAMFTVVYAAHLAWASAPECNCFGLIVAYERGRISSENLLMRNAILLGMLAVGGLASLSGHTSSPSACGAEGSAR